MLESTEDPRGYSREKRARAGYNRPPSTVAGQGLCLHGVVNGMVHDGTPSPLGLQRARTGRATPEEAPAMLPFWASKGPGREGPPRKRLLRHFPSGPPKGPDGTHHSTSPRRHHAGVHGGPPWLLA